MIKLRKYSLVDIFAFLSVLFIGADQIGINIGFNFRIVQIFLLFFALMLMLEKKYYIYVYTPLVFFGLFSLLSTLFAYNFIRSTIYYVFILFNIFLIFMVFASYVRIKGINNFVNIYRKTMYIQFVLIILQMILGFFGRSLFGLNNSGYWYGILRIPLWFYEPSYLATYLVLWFGLATTQYFCYKNKDYFKDLILSLVGIIISTSTAGYLGIAITIFITYIFWLSDNKITIKKIAVIPFVIILVLVFQKTNFYDVFINRIFTQGIDVASGGRINQWQETVDVFIKNPIFGVGPGNYGLWLHNDINYVPSNITLELMATLGISGAITFYLFNFDLIFKCFFKISKFPEKEVINGLIIGLIAFLIVLQANQSYLRLYHWMILGVLYGTYKYLKNTVKNF